MNFSEKLKTLRKQCNLSQEQLAEKICVSRQAITKWETEGGLPDIENLMAIAALFSVSIDDLLSEEKLSRVVADYAYESVMEYDISRPTHFDIHAPCALAVNLSLADNEKIRVRLASNVLQTLAQDYKVQLDEHQSRFDVNIRRVGKNSEAEGKAALVIFISLPSKYCDDIELSAIADALRINGTNCPFELDGKAKSVCLDGVKGRVSLNSNTDMEICADELPQAIEINQINATSILRIPRNVKYFTKIKGKSNRIHFALDGKAVDSLRPL
ncbi:MAG: helix-turn-helix domain-containing protein [Dehalococcoidia bacterium]|nr:helix-turn-helix domain-containing protein [Dehalococcoidia bacterium]